MKKELENLKSELEKRYHMDYYRWRDKGVINGERLDLSFDTLGMEFSLLIEFSKNHNWVILLVDKKDETMMNKKDKSIKMSIKRILKDKIKPSMEEITIREIDPGGSILKNMKEKIIFFDNIIYFYQEIFIFYFGGNRKFVKKSIKCILKESIRYLSGKKNVKTFDY